MKFMLLIRNDNSFRPPATLEPEVVTWVAEAKRRNVRISGSRFRPLSEARTVRVRAGQRQVTTGPAVQSADFNSGYEFLDCANLDEALELAATHPMASLGTVEVRPLWEL